MANYSRTIEIKSVGPIEVAKISLNRYNVFVGKQSSGKSTIAKILSNSIWMENNIATHPYNPVPIYENTYLEDLMKFHNMEGYFCGDSYIKYDSEYVTIILDKGKCHITKKNSIVEYQRRKTLYIPSERNMVVYTDSIGGANNLRSFAADWQSARDYFDERHNQKVLDLGVRYYKTGENGKTINHIASLDRKRPYDINLKAGSSGLQSVIPITIAIDFFTGAFFDSKTQEQLMKSNEKYAVRQLLEYYIKNHQIEGVDASRESILNSMEEMVSKVKTNATNFVIEEPENNLFPETQYSLVNFIIECTQRKNRKHEASITTHSPYVLSTLNILLLAGKLSKSENLTTEVKQIAGNTWLDTDEFSAWSVSGGKVNSLIDKTTQMINENYLDSVSDVLAGKFNELYKLYVKELRTRR